MPRLRFIQPFLGAERTTVRRRAIGTARFVLVSLLASALTGPSGGVGGSRGDAFAAAPTTSPTTAPVAPPITPGQLPPEVIQALTTLAKPKEREQAYRILADKGDARIIPAIQAFLSGQLLVLDGRLAIHGSQSRKSVEDGIDTTWFPLLDAMTAQPITGPAGQPLYQKTKGTKKLIRDFDQPTVFTRDPKTDAAIFDAPAGYQARRPVLDLLAALSLLHPDPEIRLASIREAGERAARVFPDPDDEEQVKSAMRWYADSLKQNGRISKDPGIIEAEPKALAAFDVALAEKPKGLFGAAPGKESIAAVIRALDPIVKDAKTAKNAEGKPLWPAPGERPSDPRIVALYSLAELLPKYRDGIETLEKNLDELPRSAAALKKQLADDPNGRFAPAYREAVAQMDAVLGDDAARLAAVPQLGDFGTMRCANVLRKLQVTAGRTGNTTLTAAIEPALKKAESYQRYVRLAQYTFAGVSTGSIFVLLALGLAIIFGLMGVINMAHGEFMMVGAFTTYAVSSLFRNSFPGAYDYFPLMAVPAAFLVAGIVGLLTEFLVIRHLYGRTTDTLVATIGIGIILVWAARKIFGDNLSVTAPRWMQGSKEVIPDLLLNQARMWTIVYCVLCVTVVYLIVNTTKLGLLLRATTQNRKMAAALGVPTRLVDALTFGFGAGLAGLAGVIVPMIDKINPSMGQDYVVMSFMVVVVGGVGKLAGAIIAGVGLGSIGNYLEPALSSIQAFARTSSVLSKVVVLAAIVAFLQKRPSGLFPPKGRVADA